MADDGIVLGLADAHRAMSEKLSYTLMTAAGVCIGFALTQAKDLKLECVHVFLVVALLCWAFSFCNGYLRIQYSIQAVLVQASIIQEAINQAEAGKVVKVFNGAIDKSAKCQVIFLAVGAVFYVLWQVALMIQRSI
ncbi:hypothetical protein [Comamonas kerstersii]|uniref:hypothetical protein n=1 Tax=Comamonas kerstersii TaxID=225992 RepID=UPI0026DAE1AF|nr:hypothetical protein [Comamonas kerstersii]